ncbi:PadR family transcriptional regulator [Blastococcus sp. SYSU D00820]
MHPHHPKHEGRHPRARAHHPRGGRPEPGDLPFRGGPFGGPFRGGPHRRGGSGRAPRGDVRTAVLLLLDEQPMHGYQLMQAIAERSGGRWTPSPGAIYPTISQLEDEGLATVTAEAGRKLVTLTDAGREHVATRRDTWSDPFAGAAADGPDVDLRGLLEQLHGAVRQVGRTGTPAQLTAAAGILADARRAMYLLLADGPEAPRD